MSRPSPLNCRHPGKGEGKNYDQEQPWKARHRASPFVCRLSSRKSMPFPDFFRRAAAEQTGVGNGSYRQAAGKQNIR
ncbi:MAG: hypothetical protein J0H14_26655 [Alphaproteobacteria bacterium]|nr:hypothetical protein [Alphaproteobacteria bacterium]